MSKLSNGLLHSGEKTSISRNFSIWSILKPSVPAPIAPESLSPSERIDLEYRHFVKNYVNKGKLAKLRRIHQIYSVNDFTLGQHFALNRLFTRIEKGDSL